MEGNEVNRMDASAIVPESKGTEVEVISKERWEEIWRMHAAGQTISEIARLLDLDRKTVRVSLRKQEWTPERRRQCSETESPAMRAIRGLAPDNRQPLICANNWTQSGTNVLLGRQSRQGEGTQYFPMISMGVWRDSFAANS